MGIENQIANFGVQAGRDIQRTVGGAINRFENNKRYQNQQANQNKMLEIGQQRYDQDRADKMAIFGAKQQQEADAQEREYGAGWAKAYFSAPDDKKGMILQGGAGEALNRGYITAEEAQGLSEQSMFKLAAQSGLDVSGGAGKGPATIQEWRYFNALGPEDQSRFLNMKRADKTLNLGDRQVVLGPQGGINQSFDVGVKPQDTAEFKANVATKVDEAKLGVKTKAGAAKNAEKIRLITTGIDTTVSSIDEALDLVNWSTTGAIGKTMSNIPGTDAYTLKQTALTVRANIGFDRLQAMRDASPTGGALGQVAVQELDALQASIRSLDQGLPADKLAANLNKVKEHYSNWREAVNLAGQAPTESDTTQQQDRSGWTLMEDSNGNKALVGPNGEIEEQ